MNKYHAFYIYAYGNESRYEAFDDEQEMLKLVKRANEPEPDVLRLLVVHGQLLEFEPALIVEAWRVKESR